MLATELTAWMQMLALTGTDARVWEPKRLRLRLFSIAGSIARQFPPNLAPPVRARTIRSTHHHRPGPPASNSHNRPDQARYPTDQHQTITGKWNPAPTQATPGLTRPTQTTERRPEDDLDSPRDRNPGSARKIEARHWWRAWLLSSLARSFGR